MQHIATYRKGVADGVPDWNAAVDQALELVKGFPERKAAAALEVSTATVARWREMRAAGLDVPEPRGGVREALQKVLASAAAHVDPAELGVSDGAFLKPAARAIYHQLIGNFVTRGWTPEMVYEAARTMICTVN
jgi:hypothetical protein